MARSVVWLLGCSGVHPLLAAPAARRLRGGTRVGARVLRALTRRGCLSGARSAKRVPRRTPQPPRRRFAPTHRVGAADWGSRFFWVLFFGEAKKSTSPAGATPGLRPQQRHTTQSAQRPDTTKSIATTAYPTSASSPKALKQAPKPSAPKKSPTHPSRAASPPGCAPPAWRHSKPCPPHTTPTAHPASWRPAPPAQCSPPA